MRLIVANFLIPATILSQVANAIDTVDYRNKNFQIKLSQDFIIKSSVVMHGKNKILHPLHVDDLNGILTLHDSVNFQPIIIEYKYLSDGLPKSVGPKWKRLNSINTNVDNKLEGIPKPINEQSTKNNTLFSSGTLFRNLRLSPLGSTEFDGGIQLQLSGEIVRGTMVSAVLTDQNIPIQPDGTTKDIEDLDNVHINISNEIFNLNAGDIDYVNGNINRKLVGIQNDFKSNGYTGSSVYANSKGTFKYTEFKGRDGDQGPYTLLGGTESRDIIILSGSEQVWVNGKMLTRGSNRDYIIDYSSGDITFTPKLIIDHDTDILVEYQYSNNLYKKTFIGANVNKKFRNSTFGFGLFNEDEVGYENNLSGIIKDSIVTSSSGSVQLSTVVLDSTGQYLLSDNILYYAPIPNNDKQNRYKVTFHFDANGSYVRKVSDLGKIFYEHKSEGNYEPTTEFYSPYRVFVSPKKHQYGFINYDYKINEKIDISGNFSTSIFNNNKFQKRENSIANSYYLGFKIDSLTFVKGDLDVEFRNWNRGNGYKSLGRENDVSYKRFWNLDSSISENINEIFLKTNYTFNHISESSINISKLDHKNNLSSKLDMKHKLLFKLLDESYLRILSVKRKGSFLKRTEGLLQYDKNYIKPYIFFINENTKNLISGKFLKTGVGIMMKNNDRKLNLELNYRDNQYEEVNNSGYDRSDDLISSIEYENIYSKYLKNNITYKKRIKRDLHSEKKLNYSLLDLKIGTLSKNKSTRWNVELRKEQTLANKVAVIYDSVGTGYGQYRFDKTFDTYIPDPNGAFISYNINTGERFINTNIYGSRNIYLDLDQLLPKSRVILKYNSRQDFQGTKPSLSRIFHPKIEDSSIVKSGIFDRLEILLPNFGRSKIWLDRNDLLNGIDPRGNERNNNRKFGLELNQVISKTYAIRYIATSTSFSFESKISSLRDRSFSGWMNDCILRVTFNELIDSDLGVIFGSNSGSHYERPFDAIALGAKISTKALLNSKGRFESELNYVKVKSNDAKYELPPESFEGYLEGGNFRINARVQYFYDRTTSFTLSLNTMNNYRYKNLINMQGEIRAHF